MGSTHTSRRAFLLSTAAVAGGAGAIAVSRFAGASEGETIVSTPGNVTIERFSDDGKSMGKETVAKVIKTEAEWKKQLASAPQPDLTFYVARQEGTERAFTGPNWDNHSAGLYRCICCDNALYTNETKYDSGTGWPSFWQPLPNAIGTTVDKSMFMTRTEVHCRRCEGHLGHVFDDGPKPTGLRYCMNGLSLTFKPATGGAA